MSHHDDHPNVLQAVSNLVLIKDDVSNVACQLSPLFAQLKHANRVANVATRAAKQRTADARQVMDQTHLGLQNLLYERRHLEREIEKCRQFASIFEDVPLQPLEEFLRLAPEEARADNVLHDEHQLMLNRLSFELAERQRLDEKKKTLTVRRDNLMKELKDYQSQVDTLGQQVEAIATNASELQKKMATLAL